jgi:hypothetical protein
MKVFQCVRNVFQHLADLGRGAATILILSPFFITAPPPLL